MEFSDECKFSLSGFLHKHNCRARSLERLNEVYQVLNNVPSFIVRWAIPKKELIAPHFFEIENLTRGTYKILPWYYAFMKLREHLEYIIPQQDGASSPFSVILRQYLDKNYPTPGMREVVQFMASSLTWFDALWKLLLAYLRDIVHCMPLSTISDLNNKTAQAVASIDDDTLKKV